MSKKMLRRFRTFLILCLFIFLILSARLVQLQVLKHDHYLRVAENNKTRILNVVAPRGEIFDRNGSLLATNRPSFTISILDLDRRESDRVIAEVAELLDMEEEEIRTLIRQQRYRQFIPVRLKADVNERVVAQYIERKPDLPGVILEVQPRRIYPEDNLAARVLGVTGEITPKQLKRWREQELDYHSGEIVGRFGGIESTWQHYLRGEDGKVMSEVNVLSQPVRELAREDPVPGDNLYLTLDAQVQRGLEKAMRTTMDELNEREPSRGLRGSAVALDPNTGAILAMVNIPDYDLNTMMQNYDSIDELNRAIAGGYPVGSSYKIVTAVAALEEGIVTPSTRLNSPSTWPVPGGGAKANFGRASHGYINIVRALQVSSNTFFYQLGHRLGMERLNQWGQNFSMGSPTGLTDIGGEKSGGLSERTRPGELMDAAIGQSHDITPLQLANMMAMTANEGIHYRPYLVEKAVDAKGNVTYQAEPEVLNQLDVSEQTWQTVKSGIEAATAAGGTAGRFRNFPYPVQIVGKTGTAQVGRNIPDHSVFISYAPGDVPEVALAVLIERSGIGGAVAVPISWDFYLSYFEARFETLEEEEDLGLEIEEETSAQETP